MNVQVETEGGLTILRLSGPSLDASSARAFRRQFLEHVKPEARAILDLGSVEFVDSAGCGCILALARHLSPDGKGPGSLALCAARPQVRGLFEMVRMHKIIDLYNDRDEAVRSIDHVATTARVPS